MTDCPRCKKQTRLSWLGKMFLCPRCFFCGKGVAARSRRPGCAG